MLIEPTNFTWAGEFCSSGYLYFCSCETKWPKARFKEIQLICVMQSVFIQYVFLILIILGLVQLLEEKYVEAIRLNASVTNLQARLKLDLKFFNREAEELNNLNANSVRDFQHIYLDLLEQQRKMLDKMNHKFEFDEDLIRKYLSLIDMEEFKIREKLVQE
jgi:hypothetical protein